MVNKNLRKVLLKKLKCSPQALSQRVKRLKKDHPMISDDATYVIAHQQGIQLDKYLLPDQVDHIRSILSQVQRPIHLKEHPKSKITKYSRTSKALIISGDFKEKDHVLSENKLHEAKEMAKIYPLLYVLENSIREVIESFMQTKYGDNWWHTKAPRGLQDKVTQRMKDDIKNSWHQRRGSRPIDYLDLNNLPSLMRHIASDVIPDIIPSNEWFDQFIDEVYRSRCVICHMNPLDKDNISAVMVRFRQWQKQVKGKL